MEDIILYPGVKLEDFDEVMEEQIIESEHVKMGTEEIEMKFSPESLDIKQGIELANEEHELMHLHSDSVIGDAFDAAMDDRQYQMNMWIKSEKIEITSTILSEKQVEDPLILSQAPEAPRPEQTLLDERCLLPPCRLCAIPCTDMIYIFGPTMVHRSILEKIQHCLPITVKESDTISKQVCRLCLEKLESCYRFYETVTQAERQLLSIQTQASPNRLNIDSGVQSQTSLQGSGQQIMIQSAASMETMKKNSDEDKNDSSHLDKENGPWNSGCENQITEPPMESLDSGGPSASESKEVVCDSAQNSSISDTVHSEKELKADKDVSESVNSGPPSTTTESNPQVESSLSLNEKSSRDLTRKTPRKHVSDDDNQLPRDEVTKAAAADRSVCSQIMKCYLCGDALPTIRECFIHAGVHASKNYYPCCFCDEIVTTEKAWEKHWSHHLAHRENKKCEKKACIDSCKECGKNFMSKVRLERHKLYHKVAKNQREKFDKILDSETSLQQHMVVRNRCQEASAHTSGIQLRNNEESNANEKERVFRCTFCKQRLGSDVSLARHTKSCFRIKKKYMCDHCGEEFDEKTQMTLHIQKHTKERSQSCNTRLKPYKSKVTRDSHRKIHTDKNPFKFSNSEKAFTSHPMLKQHTKNTHMEADSHFCSVCKKRFNSANSLKQHAVKHKIRGSYPCDVCGTDYVFAIYLERHKKNAHGLLSLTDKAGFRTRNRPIRIENIDVE